MAEVSWRAISAVVFSFIAAVVLVSCTSSHEILAEVFTDIYGMGNLGVAVFMLLYIEGVLVGFPLTVLDITLVFLYPWQQAYTMAWFGTVIAASVCFFNARFLFRATADELMKDHEILAALHKTLHKSPWRYVILLRLIFIPGFVMNYGLPAIGVDFIPYLGSEIIVRTFSIAWHLVLGINGKSLRDSIAIWHFNDRSLLILGVTGSLSVIGLIGLWRLSRAVTKEIMQHS